MYFVIQRYNGFVDPIDFITTKYPLYFSPQTHFNFAAHASQCWTCGFDCEVVPEQNQTDADTYRIATDDFDNSGSNNPGFVSPGFSKGINTNQFQTMRFSARVDGSEFSSPAYVWVKDPSGNWNHPVWFGEIKGYYFL